MEVIGQDDNGIGLDRIVPQGIGIGASQTCDIIGQQGVATLCQTQREEMAGAGGKKAAVTRHAVKLRRGWLRRG